MFQLFKVNKYLHECSSQFVKRCFKNYTCMSSFLRNDFISHSYQRHTHKHAVLSTLIIMYIHQCQIGHLTLESHVRHCKGSGVTTVASPAPPCVGISSMVTNSSRVTGSESRSAIATDCMFVRSARSLCDIVATFLRLTLSKMLSTLKSIYACVKIFTNLTSTIFSYILNIQADT